MTQIRGTRDTANILSNKLVVDMSNDIALLNPSETPFTVFIKQSKSKIRTITNPKFEWLEDDLGARWDAINKGAGYLSTDTALDVDNGQYFTIGDTIKVPRTGEVMLVTDIATNTLTVTRGFGVTAAAALVDNDPIVIIGNANVEGGLSRDINTTLEIPKFNYTQIFKTTFGVTNTQDATKTYGTKDLAYQTKKKGIEHMIDMERAFLFGEKKNTTSNGKPLRATGGLDSFLTSNRYDAGGALTQAEFDQNFCEKIFAKGSKEKLFMASMRLMSVINGWSLGKLQTKMGESTYGLAITEYVTPFGKLHMVMNPLLEGTIYGGYGFALDVDNISYAPLPGRDTKLETNIQANDADERKDQYKTEAGLEVRLPDTHGVIYGVTG